jgi:hypothetical protein
MNSRTFLSLITLALLIYGASHFFPIQKNKAFKIELIKIKPDAVSTISIKIPKEKAFILTRSENGWIASKENLNIKVLQPKVKELLKALQLIETEQIVAYKKEKWPNFKVDTSSGTHIQIYENDIQTKDFILGQLNRKDSAYLRFSDEVEVYAIDGSHMASIGKSFDNYRSKTFLSLTASAEIAEIKLTTEQDTFDLKITENGWVLNGAQAIDSISIAEYLVQLHYMETDRFADDFDELKAREFPMTQLKITDHYAIEVLEILCFSDSLHAERDFVLHNRLFPDQYFASDSAGLYQLLIDGLIKKLQ